MLFIAGGFVLLAWLQFKQTAYLKGLINENRTTSVKNSPNEISKQTSGTQEFHEDNPISFPKDLKIQIEGVDGTPYEYDK